MNRRKVLLIGGSGFTGQRLLALQPRSWEVHALVRSAVASTSVTAGGATPISGDLDRPDTVAAALRDVAPDLVVCLASLGFGHAPGLVTALESSGAPRTVFTSTTAIFTNLEPASKSVRVDAEELITRSPLPSLVLRPTMIYGRPGDRNMERLLRWLKRAPVVVAPDGGRAEQQPVHVDDLAATIIRAAESTVVNEAVDVPGPDSVAFREVVSLAGQAIGRTARTVGVPLGPLSAAVRLQERLLPRPFIKHEQVQRLVEHKRFDPGPAQEFFGHEARPLGEGLASEAELLFGSGSHG